jgi:hypothetical protein
MKNVNGYIGFLKFYAQKYAGKLDAYVQHEIDVRIALALMVAEKIGAKVEGE